MKINKLRLLVSLLLIVNFPSLATTSLSSIKFNFYNQAKLQRGAQLFMNYCAGCHALRYLNNDRLSEHLKSVALNNNPEKLLKDQLILTTMPKEDAFHWFGRVPPDLSLIARQRDTFWLYTYLKSFYADSRRPYGSNNLLFPNVNMPNVLESLQKEMTPAQFEEVVDDLVTFLVFVAEPTKLIRYRLGIKVLIFLVIFLMIAYPLKRFYWRHL